MIECGVFVALTVRGFYSERGESGAELNPAMESYPPAPNFAQVP